MTNGDLWATQHPELRKLQGATKQKSLATPTPRKPRPQPLPLRKPERAGDVLVIPLPLPAPELQPNRKTSLHHMARARLVKATRDVTTFIARQVAPETPWSEARIDVTLWTSRRLDRDNAIGWLKAVFDSLESAGIIANDSGLSFGDIRQVTGRAAGDRREVELTITRIV